MSDAFSLGLRLPRSLGRRLEYDCFEMEGSSCLRNVDWTSQGCAELWMMGRASSRLKRISWDESAIPRSWTLFITWAQYLVVKADHWVKPQWRFRLGFFFFFFFFFCWQNWKRDSEPKPMDWFPIQKPEAPKLTDFQSALIILLPSFKAYWNQNTPCSLLWPAAKTLPHWKSSPYAPPKSEDYSAYRGLREQRMDSGHCHARKEQHMSKQMVNFEEAKAVLVYGDMSTRLQ